MNKRFHLFALLIISSIFIFASCTDDIYTMINQEVTLETNAIKGQIYSFVRNKDKLYTSNGYLYEKTATSSSDTGSYNKQWTNITRGNSTFSGKHIMSLASDSKYLYALAVEYIDNSDDDNVYTSKQIYFYDGSSWSSIEDSTLNTLLGGTSSVTNIQTIFYNNATGGDVEDRNAYALLYNTTDSAKHVYKLNGANAPTLVADGTNGSSSSSVAAVRYNGTDYFSSYSSITANDKLIYYAKSGDMLYYANKWDSTNGFTLNGTETGIDEDAGTIYSLAVTADYILMGTSKGITHAALDSKGLPADGTSSFSNNAASTLTTTYEVHTVFALDPAKKEYETDLYGTTIKQGPSTEWKEICLWAYYPNRISEDTGYGTWNKDGTADDANTGN